MLDKLSDFNFFEQTQSFFGMTPSIDADFLWLIYTIVFVVYGILTLIFVYHWYRYDIPGSWTFIAQIVYFVGSLGLLMLAGMAISAF